MRTMKNRIWTTLTSLLLAICFLFVGCDNPQQNSGDSSSSEPTGTYCTIAIVGNDHCEGLPVSQKVMKGEDAVFTFQVKNGYTFDSADYSNYEVEIGEPNEKGVREVTLILHAVKYPTTVSIKTKEASKVVLVKLNESEYFRLEKAEAYVTTGSSIDFTLYYQESHTFQSINYEGEYTAQGVDSDVDENNERKVVLTLKNVTEELVLDVTSREVAVENTPIEGAEITYYLNGGRFINAKEEEKYTVAYALKYHINPNTSIGTDMMEREGYVQIGWNTKADASGQHFGLGSKVPSVKKGMRLNLYAEWEKWTDVSLFTYELIDIEDLQLYYENFNLTPSMPMSALFQMRNGGETAAIITRYIGEDVQKLVIPEKLGGYNVVGINENAITNCGSLTTVVLPKSVLAIESLAFNNCSNFQELYFYDNMARIRYNSLGQTFTLKTMHMNAIMPPVWGTDEMGQLANKIELLRNRDESRPKVVVFGSCSGWYGVNARDLKAQFPEYDVYNMGLVGGACALYQTDLIKKTLNKGDVYVHVMEAASRFQWYGDVTFDNRVFITVENNYDLLAELDMQRYSSVLKSLNDYFIAKRKMVEENHRTGTYNASYMYLSPEGDITKPRKGGYVGTTGYTFPNLSDLTQVNAFTKKDPFSYMKDVYAEIGELVGSKVLFAFGPISRSNVNFDRAYEVEQLFYTEAKNKDVPIVFLNTMDDGLMDSQYFFDSNFHLSTEGAVVFTQMLATKLERYL